MLDTKFWKKYFKEYDILNQLIPYDNLLDVISKKLLDRKNHGKVLDVGSGTGNLSERLTMLGFDLISIDFSLEGIDIHKSKNPNANILHLDITKPLPIESNSFDFIVSNNVLYTIDKNKRSDIINELYRVLKPEGLLVISNLSTKFKPFDIYIDHISSYYKQKGIFLLVWHLFSLMLPTIKIFYYNYLIKKEGLFGGYSFFSDNEQSELLKQSGFINVTKDEIYYSGQAILNTASK